MLRDVVTAADLPGRDEAERTDRPAYDSRANFDRPAAEPVHRSKGAEERPIVEVTRQSGDRAHGHEQRPDLDSDISQRLDREVWSGAEKGTGDGDRGGRGAQCGDRDARLEPP